MIARMDAHYRNGILDIFGFPEGSLPVKYFGVPLITTRLTSNDCKILVERMVARVKCWTSKFLSYAGRLQLIQSVRFSIQVYWTSIFILPKKVIKMVEQVLRDFLWSGIELKHYGAKVSWEDITYPKPEGGLDIKKLEEWNKATMARHI